MALLVCCARVHLEPADAARLRDLARAVRDWDEVVRLARPHGLLPLLYRHLAGTCPEAVPEGVLQRLREHFEANAQRNLYLTVRLLGALDLLRSHGIEALTFKGPAQAAAYYGSVALREYVDLDLLIRPRDVQAARDLLTAHGYRSPLRLPPAREDAYLWSRSEYYLENPRDGTALELHWAILPRYFALPFDVEAAWARRETVALGDATVATLGTEDLLLVLCLHGYSHMWERLEWICGVAELVRARPELDWDRVFARARELGGELILLLGLSLAGSLLAAPVPATVLRRAREDARVSRLEAVALARLASAVEGPADVVETVRFQLEGRERLADRLRFLLRLTTTPTVEDWALLPLPEALGPAYGLIRPLALLQRHVLGRRARNGRLSHG